MKKTQTAILIGLFASTTFIAQAQGLSFSDFDADNSGMVSEQEFINAKSKRIASKAKEGRKMQGLANAPSFSSIDVNNDGLLSKSEMMVMQQAHNEKGQGDRQMARPPRPVFADFDVNHDNSLTEKEYYDARNKRIGERAKEGRKMKGLANLASFADLDANADGKVSQDEFSAFLMEHEKKGH